MSSQQDNNHDQNGGDKNKNNVDDEVNIKNTN